MRNRLLILSAVVALVGCTGSTRNEEDATRDAQDAMKGNVSSLNPVAFASGPVRTIYVGGQNGVDSAGNVVGKADIAAQATQVAKNLKVALAAAGARVEHVLKWNLHVVQGQVPDSAIEAFNKEIGSLPYAPTITVLYVAGLANPDYLLEVDAVAVIPAE